MRLRMALVLCATLGASAVLSSAVALAQPHHAGRLADAATVTRTLYIQGPYFDPAGRVVTFAGVASLNVSSSGSYTGTMTTIGTKPASLPVAGTIITPTMTLTTTLNGEPITITARNVQDRVYDRGSTNQLPATTNGLEYQGAITAGGQPSGYVTAIDTSIMREYSFAATVTKGPDKGMDLNASLFVLLDRYGGIHGYLLQDDTNYLFPLQSGAINRGRMLVHLDLVGGGQIIGVANASTSVIARLVVYKGTFGGPSGLDSGTWLSSPPEQ